MIRNISQQNDTNATFAGYLSLQEASAILPKRNGKRVHVATIKRWIINGIGGVRLSAHRLGQIWYVTPDAITKFVADRSPGQVVFAPNKAARVAAAKKRLKGILDEGTEASDLLNGRVPE
jgi:hypothetical protein